MERFCNFTKIILLSALLLPGIKCMAQYENVWAFGHNAGIDFNNGVPKGIQTSIITTEGCASICDADGRLLFYSDGTYVWNKHHDLMPNGEDLTQIPPTSIYSPTSSTSQAALIVPMPGERNKYYLFSLSSSTGGVPWDMEGRLYYSVIEMSLDNGLGGVDANKKGILLDSNLTEQMTAVSGNSCDIWVVVVPRYDTVIRTYHIDANGINIQPVISSRLKGENSEHLVGNLVAAHGRNRIAMVSQKRIILYNFDVNYGKVSLPIVLGDTMSEEVYYGLCFSPDDSKLYAGSFGGQMRDEEVLCQFDLSSGDSLTMATSKAIISDSGDLVAFKTGPDGKIYCVGLDSDVINVIERPDLPGIACKYVPDVFRLVAGTRAMISLPNSIASVSHINVYHSEKQIAYCQDSIILEADNPSGSNYRWQDGSTGATRKVYDAGTYWLSYRVSSSCVLDDICVDTFYVSRDTSRRNVFHTAFATLCKTDTLLLIPSILSGSGYRWENGDASHQRIIDRAGIYKVSYQVDSLCQYHTDSFVVTYPEKDYEVSFSVRPFVCVHDTVLFRNTSDPYFNRYQWTFDSNTVSILNHPQHIYTHAGSYEVMLIGSKEGKCLDTTYQKVVVDDIINTRFSKDKDSICTGASITFSHQMDPTVIKNLNWEFGDGSSMYSPDAIIRHGYDVHGIMPIIIRVSFRGCPAQDYLDTVYVSQLPALYLGTDSSLCWNGKPVILRNLYDQPEGIYSNKWNTGDTSAILEVNHPGNYSLTIQSSLGCTSTATVRIHKDCYINIPNVFTPNGDGYNDFFFPRELLSQNITRFEMRIFNRWGQLIFITQRTEGYGWDGKLNGIDQSEGVYVYLIEVEIKGGETEYYQGNITLIR